ncbi:MAG: hypothetical protein K0U19_06160 [Proteobacteria bacterium]|nr:hypothetical protein [Pseudomonadota bacterium]
MSKINVLIISFLAAATLSGCGTSAVMTRSASELLEFRDSRMFRLRVDWVTPTEFYKELINKHTEEEFAAAYPGINGKKEALQRWHGVIAGRWYSIPGGVDRTGALIPVGMDVKPGDIIDIYGGDTDDNALRGKKFVTVRGFGAIGNILFHTNDKAIPSLAPPVVVGIVCRGTAADCRMDNRPGTQIGIGRQMASATDYRGVEAESKQIMYKGDTTVAEFFNLNVCVDCGKNEQVIQ